MHIGKLIILTWGLLFQFAYANQTAPSISETQAQALKQRVTDRWQKLHDHDFVGAYQFSSPQYRNVFADHQYHLKYTRNYKWVLEQTEVLDYEAETGLATVRSRINLEPLSGFAEEDIRKDLPANDFIEKWLFLDDEWWYIDDR